MQTHLTGTNLTSTCTLSQSSDKATSSRNQNLGNRRYQVLSTGQEVCAKHRGEKKTSVHLSAPHMLENVARLKWARGYQEEILTYQVTQSNEPIVTRNSSVANLAHSPYSQNYTAEQCGPKYLSAFIDWQGNLTYHISGTPSTTHHYLEMKI